MNNVKARLVLRLPQPVKDQLRGIAKEHGFDSLSHYIRYSTLLTSKRKNIDRATFKAAQNDHVNANGFY
jgi:hypothetical protein